MHAQTLTWLLLGQLTSFHSSVLIAVKVSTAFINPVLLQENFFFLRKTRITRIKKRNDKKGALTQHSQCMKSYLSRRSVLCAE